MAMKSKYIGLQNQDIIGKPPLILVNVGRNTRIYSRKHILSKADKKQLEHDLKEWQAKKDDKI